MFSVPHLVIIFIVVLVVFGPHKLPELARTLGKMMAEFRKASTDFKMAFEEEMRTIERQAREVEWKKTQDAAASASAEQPATLATPAGTETPRILPEVVAPTEPTISPVSEAVPRESQAISQAVESPAVSDELPITAGTSPAKTAPSESGPADPGNLPAHDERQSA
jgi:sec-independent protein translocase protein TatB